MVREYKRKGDRGNWDDTQLKLAINSIKNGKTIKSCAFEYGIPRSTLQRKVSCENLTSSSNSSSSNPGFKRTFDDAQEEALLNIIVDLEKRLEGLSTKELRKLAYDYATDLGIANNFDKRTGLAGKDWLRSFMKRHELSNRKAEPTSAARANGFNKHEVDKFFTLLQEVQDKFKFKASNIWNVDETGISIVAKSGSRVIARKGRKQVGGKTAAERGETVTAEICMSATGIFMPPMLIFPRVKVNEQYLQNKPEGSWAVWRKSGWMESDIFTDWFEKFIEFSQASAKNPVLLLLDGHHTHVKNLKVAQLGKENGVTILCFPPHCTHRMQPLDVAFMKPLNTFYTEEINLFQRSGLRVQIKDVFGIFGRAWQRAAKIETAVNAFKKTGIVPLNVHVFDSHFSDPKNACSSENANDQATAQLSEESHARISQYKEVLQNILAPKHTSNDNQDHHAIEVQEIESITNSGVALPDKLNTSSSTDSDQKNVVEPTVQIPLSYIIQAKPLISLLNSALGSATNQKKVLASKKRGTAMIVTSVLLYKNKYLRKFKFKCVHE